MRQPHATRCNGAFCFGKQQSLILRLLLHVLHLNNVCRCTSQLPLRGSFSKRSTGRWVNGSTGQRVKRVTSQRCMQVDLAIALRASFSKRSTGRRVNGSNGSTGRRVSGSNGSTGQQVTFTFTILYVIADDARLTPPRCKKHTAYDDTRLTPHHCKKHTASFARSTGKFHSPEKTYLLQESLVIVLAKVG